MPSLTHRDAPVTSKMWDRPYNVGLFASPFKICYNLSECLECQVPVFFELEESTEG